MARDMDWTVPRESPRMARATPIVTGTNTDNAFKITPDIDGDGVADVRRQLPGDGQRGSGRLKQRRRRRCLRSAGLAAARPACFRRWG